MKVMKTKTFSDYCHIGHGSYDYVKGHARCEFTDFYNEHPYIKIISVIPRPIYVKNAGNGTGYYDIDVIYLVDKRKESIT